MTDFNRRDALKVGAGAVAGAAIVANAGEAQAQAATELKLTPEKGAKLRVLRPSKFVQGDETVWLENTKKYQQMTGVEVRVDSESWEDLRPKSAVAANVGRGPDIVYAWYDDAHQYPDKLLPLTDVYNYLDKKYEGWYDVAKKFSTRGRNQISVVLGSPGSKMVYRKSHLAAAGFSSFPNDFPGLLECCKALKAKNTPAGFALGNAVGDANGWCHWIVWSHGGKMVDDKDKVVIDSPETIKALEYVKQLYDTFIPGTLSWLDINNNKAFVDGQLSLTNNGISVYYAAKTSNDPKLKEMALDIEHANYPVGPVGRTTEVNLTVPAMVFKYTKFPNAAKDYITMATSKGLSDRRILWRHAFRPSSITLFTSAALNMGSLIGGAIVVETIFATYGVGFEVFAAISGRQYIALQSIVGLISIFYVLFNLVIDIVAGYVDPRTRDRRVNA